MNVDANVLETYQRTCKMENQGFFFISINFVLMFRYTSLVVKINYVTNLHIQCTHKMKAFQDSFRLDSNSGKVLEFLLKLCSLINRFRPLCWCSISAEEIESTYNDDHAGDQVK